MNINVSVIGLDQVRKILEGAEKQMKYATMVALTRTAKHTQAMTYDEFRKEFDRPTPTTMRSLFVTPAKKTNMEAKVFMKDREMGGKNIQAMADIIGHHFSGGTRNRKALENLLIRFNFMQRGEFIRPGNAAKLDQYGNISRGQIQQIISQLKIVRSGFDNSPTSSKRSRRNVAKTGKIFWSYGREGTKKPLVDKATGIQYGYTGGAGSKLNSVPTALMLNISEHGPHFRVLLQVSRRLLDADDVALWSRQDVSAYRFPCGFAGDYKRSHNTSFLSNASTNCRACINDPQRARTAKPSRRHS